jgi:hypothetical protein
MTVPADPPLTPEQIQLAKKHSGHILLITHPDDSGSVYLRDVLDDNLRVREGLRVRDRLRAEDAVRRNLADICQSEGPRGETMCMKLLGHEGRCGWESA